MEEGKVSMGGDSSHELPPRSIEGGMDSHTHEVNRCENNRPADRHSQASDDDVGVGDVRALRVRSKERRRRG